VAYDLLTSIHNGGLTIQLYSKCYYVGIKTLKLLPVSEIFNKIRTIPAYNLNHYVEKYWKMIEVQDPRDNEIWQTNNLMDFIIDRVLISYRKKKNEWITVMLKYRNYYE
jgi:hypothetical protein